MEDKRKFKRIRVSVPAEARGRKVWQVKDVDNLSAGGLFLVTDKIEPPGTAIEVVFGMEKDPDKVFTARAVVAWTREKSSGRNSPAGMGVRFIRIYPADSGKVIGGIVKNSDK